MASFYKRGDYQWEAKIRKVGFLQLARTAKATAYLRSIDIVRYRDDRLKVDGPHYSPSQRVMESGEPLTYGLFYGGFNGNLLKMLIK